MTQPTISSLLQPMVAQIHRRVFTDRFEAFNDCEAGFRLARAMHDHAAFIAIAIDYGLVIDQHGYPDASISILYEALQLAQSYHLFQDEARLLNVIGRAVYTRAEYRRAMQAWAHCLEVAALADDQVSWTWAKLGIAQIYDALNDNHTAVILLRQAEARGRPLGDDMLLLNILLNLGVNLYHIADLPAALSVYQESLQLAERLQHLDDLGEILFRIAEVELAQHNIAAALQHLDEAQRICEQSHHMWALANIHGVRAQALAEQDKLQEALLEVAVGIDYATRSGSAHIQMRLLELQSTLAERNQDASLTLAAYKAAMTLREQISPHDYRQQLTELEDLAGLRPSPGRILLELANHPQLEHCELAALAQLLCETACQIMPKVLARYAAFEPDLQQFSVIFGQAELERLALPPRLLNSLRQGEMTVAHNAQHHQLTWECYERLFQARQVLSVLIVPLRLNESLYGALLIEHPGSIKNWSVDEVQQANQLAIIGTRALANIERQIFQADIARLNAKLQQSNTELEQRVVERTLELQKAMAHLVESEKLASLGNLVAGFAHELNTPLGTTLTAASTLLEKNREILGAVNEGAMKRSLLMQYLDESSMIAELVERNARRASNLIANLKQVAVDTASSNRRDFDLRQVIEETIAAQAVNLRHKNVRIENRIPAGLQLLSYPGALEQIISNFIHNSLVHAFTPEQEGQIVLDGRMLNAQQIELSYRDNGCGIPDAIKKRVFDPFFTTRFGHGGSGLGLYLVYSLVNGTLGGVLELQDAPAGGVWFSLRLPVEAPAEQGAHGSLYSGS
ncbi:ATP-binding protein [Chitinibacter sp. ZOR0017]|uniref:ATP-binding protein n=1 Tax=Chitinibacter sp. ZOR0017 TaxID=1339254 RepID=UPI00068E607B|nr:ATP-binding protein [Chitinibacter sp. ZOR0017]